ncbi:Bug family tripartite tricarboxylate transporter substrate binding protein [Paracoccus litorisediminis]|uniref:Tripartite-type tricarboxylate transporter, receptor component TctC n=1 Tax=Paracoccus litorisediminis TaxID=2006130 RepID=A0A844HQ56_9RHOB|nr:tripartite tricarboxylate transporter substrate binding protein [Paracoccus litorisediminis]MTH62020.1 hypothetical protein [Paracoccus litorisediminis]
MTISKITRRSLLAAGLSVPVVLAAPGLLRAKTYATKPVRLFVGTAAAGSNDLVARLIAPGLEAALGQPVVVENRPGGATTMAVGLVAQAEPDGHTLLVSSAAALSTYVTSVKKPPSLLDDLDHVTMICDGAFIYAVHKDVPAANTAEFVALMKERPGSVRYGATGTGGGIHLSGTLFQQQTGTSMVVIQYANAGMRLNELIANQTQLGIAGAAVLEAQIRAGALRPLFVAGGSRLQLMPDVPTSLEDGLTGLEGISNWFGLHGPKGLSPEVSVTLNTALASVLTEQRVQDGLAAAGFAVDQKGADALVSRMRMDAELTRKIADSAGIRVE